MSQTADRFVWCAILNVSELHSISITADVRTLLERMWYYCCCFWVFLGNVICDRDMNMIVFMYNYDHDDALRLSAVNCPQVYSDFLQHCFHFLRYYSRCFVFFLGITWFCVFLEYSELIMFTSHIMLKVFHCWYFHTHINIRWGYEKDILTVASLTRSMSVDILQLLYNIVWKNAFEDACCRWMTLKVAEGHRYISSGKDGEEEGRDRPAHFLAASAAYAHCATLC